MKGFYVLTLKVDKTVALDLKSIRAPPLEPGLYVYVGSAMGSGSTSLERRIARHFRLDKKIHWHIDHLLKESKGPLSAVWARSEDSVECQLVETIANQAPFVVISKGFGASDCKMGCYSHLFKYIGQNSVVEDLMNLIRNLGFFPHVTYDGYL